MKRLLLVILMFLVVVSNAQEVIDFMGIPIDGPVSEMIAKLEEKGFRKMERNGIWEGFLDGVPVQLNIRLSKDKVYEIDICYDVEDDHAQIAQCINGLVSKFKDNPKYKEVQSEMITEDDLTESKLKTEYLGYFAYFTQIGANGYVAIGLNRLNYMLGENNGNPPEKDYQLWVQMKYVNAANAPAG